MLVAVIGGQKFEDGDVGRVLRVLDDDDVLLTTNSVGFERALVAAADGAAAAVQIVEKDAERYGKSAPACAICECLILAEAIFVVGSGSRQKVALDWYKRCEGWRDAPSRSLEQL